MKHTRYRSTAVRISPLVVVALVAGCSDIDRPHAPGDGWQITDPPTSVPAANTDADRPADAEVPAPPALLDPSSCAVELEHAAISYWINPRRSFFTPNDGLFVATNGFASESTSFSIATGEPYEGHSAQGLVAVDDAWTVGIFEEPYGAFEVRPLDAPDVLARVAGSIVATALSGDGTLASATFCEGEATTVEIVNLSTANSRRVEIDALGSCHAWSASMNRALFTADNDYLIVTTVSGELWSIDTRTLEVVGIAPHGPAADGPSETIIADVALRPGHDEVVTTGADGTMRRWTISSLEQVGDDVEVGAFPINQMTYAPRYTVSPVAFTPDGKTIAFVDTEGDIVVETGRQRAVLVSPPVPDEIAEWEHSPNVPVVLSFSPSGVRLGVGYAHGHGVWSCGAGAIERSGQLRLDAPSTTTAENGYAKIPLEAFGASPLVAFRARTVAGEPLGAHFGTDGYVHVYTHGLSSERVVIEADDGYATTTATVQVRATH